MKPVETALSVVAMEAPAATLAAAPYDLDALFRQYASYVAAIGLRLLGRPDEVDDLVQDVFLASHRGLGGLRDPSRVKSWLATVAVRLARRRLRRRRVLGWVGFEPSCVRDDALPCTGSQEHRVLLSRAYRVLDELPVSQRVAWVLRHVQGEQLDRTAELCACSLATVKRRIAAAQAALQEAFDDE